MQYHEVKVNLEFREKSDCFWASNGASVTVGDFDECSLFVDYIYLFICVGVEKRVLKTLASGVIKPQENQIDREHPMNDDTESRFPLDHGKSALFDRTIRSQSKVKYLANARFRDYMVFAKDKLNFNHPWLRYSPT